MAGSIFSPPGSCGALEAGGCHPLVCLLCREPYQQPCLLDCYHNFCAGCLRGRAADGRLACPLCGHRSVVKGGSGLPPVDRLLQFLVDGSAEGEEAAQCANCDLRCAKAPAAVRPVPRGDAPRQDVRPARHRRPGQAHQGHPQEVPAARGALHHVLHREEVHALHQLLPRHAGGEPRALHRHRDGVRAGLREARPGRHGRQGAADGHARGHRPAQGHGGGGAQQCQRGGDGHQLPLQQHAGEAGGAEAGAAEGGAEPARGEGEGVPGAAGPPRRPAAHAAGPPRHLLGLPELRQQSRVPRPGLPTHGAAAEDRQAAASPETCADQQARHGTGTPFPAALPGTGGRPRAEPPRRSPPSRPQISTEYRAEFARCLEPLLTLTPRRSVVGSAGAIGPGIAAANMIAGSPCSKTLLVPGRPAAGEGMASSSVVRKPSLHRYISTKVLLAEGGDSPFTQHCRSYESTYRALQAEIQSLKDQVQELHRDLTKHHSLIKTEIMSEILQKSLQMDVQIAAHYSSVEMMRSVFEEIWEETYQRVANEQEIYEAQLHDLLQLRQENSYLTTITRQIAPYVRSIAKVKERLEPRLQECREPRDERAETLLRVCDEGPAPGEAAHRSEAAGGGEEGGAKAPESKGDGRAGSAAAEDPLLKNKDYYRSKQKSGADGAARKEFAT